MKKYKTLLDGSLLRQYFLSAFGSVLLSDLVEWTDECLIDVSKDSFQYLSDNHDFDHSLCLEIINYIRQEYNNGFISDSKSELSWSYQYLNSTLDDNPDNLVKTQFFTESYMIESLLRQVDVEKIDELILDPCI